MGSQKKIYSLQVAHLLGGLLCAHNGGTKLNRPYVVQYAQFRRMQDFFSVAGVFVAGGMLGFCLCAVLTFPKN